MKALIKGCCCSRPTLGYWKIRGMGAQVTYLLDYCGIDYNLKQYKASFEDGKVDLGEWKDHKWKLDMELPNLPYFLDGDIKVSETMAIMRYICNRYYPKLLGRDLKEKTQIDMMSSIIHDLKLYSLTYPFYTHGDKAKIEKDSRSRLDPIVKCLGDKKYLVGEKICYLDFILFEVCNVMDFLTEGKVWEEYPTLK